ncbi:MAG: NTP transferase domain-containing protein [Bdellovibrionales bacterium]|nr:NTP transferase domain-containing protein [Oligoflexia bacterium]
MVLGAGLGSRLKPFTAKRPKPLMPVMGVPCIEFALLSLKSAGVTDVTINTHAHAEQMRTYFKSKPVSDLNLHESNEENLLLGSGGGFRHALNTFDNSAFFSMNADVIHFASLSALERKHAQLKNEHNVAITLVLANGKALIGQQGEYREILTDPVSGLIIGFGEKKKNVPFYTGTAIFESEAFSHLSDNEVHEFVAEVLEPMIDEGRVGYIESDALWIDIGSPELWAEAQRRLKLALDQGDLPVEVASRLKRADPTLGGTFSSTRNKIRLEGIEYEIKDLRHP